jgi:sugar/nucleoside kinase (ribokinase family)
MSSKKYDATIVGLYVLDILGRPVSEIPKGGDLAYIDELRLTVAGTAGGTIIDCAKLGLSTLAVGAVGDDEKADFVVSVLEKFGADTAGFERIKGVPTSSTILNIRPNGERPALHLRGACDYFLPPNKEKLNIFDCKVFHLGGTGLLKKLDGSASVELLKDAKENECITTWDLIGATESTIDIVKPLLPHIDYFMPSIEEASIMCGLDDPKDIAKYYLDNGVTNCVLTMGGEGSLFVNKDETIKTPAFDINVVDTTGCGDAFDAGMITSLINDFDLEKSLKFATTTSGLVATGLGSDAGIIDFDDTINKMNTLKIK